MGSGDGPGHTFTASTPGSPIVGIESIDEEFFENGSLGARAAGFNGD